MSCVLYYSGVINQQIAHKITCVYYPGCVCKCVCELVKGQQRIAQGPCGTQRSSLPQPVVGKRIEVCLSFC